jgi:hypothetical protein
MNLLKRTIQVWLMLVTIFFLSAANAGEAGNSFVFNGNVSSMLLGNSNARTCFLRIERNKLSPDHILLNCVDEDGFSGGRSIDAIEPLVFDVLTFTKSSINLIGLVSALVNFE